jgi:hypothetical protein
VQGALPHIHFNFNFPSRKTRYCDVWPIVLFSFFGVGWDWVHLVREPLFGLLYQSWMIDDECGEVGGMRIGRGNRSTRRKPAYSCSLIMIATLWASLMTVLHFMAAPLTFMFVGVWERGWWSWVRTWEHEILSQGFYRPCSDERFSLKKSLDHTLLKIIYLIYFPPLHNDTLFSVHS